MNLTRVEAAAWPTIRLRPAPAPGEGAYAWTRPAERGDGWATAAPAEVGVDKAAVAATVRAILAGEAGALHAFLVARDGKLVVEEYFHGWGMDDLHDFASCTKSVSSLLVGIAVDQGLVAGVDAPLLDFFPEYAEGAGRGWEALRLEHLLTMTMGLDWEGNERYRLPPPDVDRFADILGRHVVVPPGRRWNYSDRNMSLLPGVFRQTTGVAADAFAAEHLFAPLGITVWDWDKKRWQAHPDMVGSLELRPRDIVKLGQLVLDGGAWQGRRVISAQVDPRVDPRPRAGALRGRGEREEADLPNRALARRWRRRITLGLADAEQAVELRRLLQSRYPHLESPAAAPAEEPSEEPPPPWMRRPVHLLATGDSLAESAEGLAAAKALRKAVALGEMTREVLEEAESVLSRLEWDERAREALRFAV